MKKRIVFVLALVWMLCLVGCGTKPLNYYSHGYDFSNSDCKQIIYQVYHSNTDTHNWELLTTFTCTPEAGHYFDVSLDGSENLLKLNLLDRQVEKTENAESIQTEVIGTFEFAVNGFDGAIPGYQTFPVENTDGEQFYRLYPITNGNGRYFMDLALDQPYDTQTDNLDNILITVTLE